MDDHNLNRGALPTMTSPADDNDASQPLDADLSCLECGYNLRGLAGDPIRCPECFHLNPLAELQGESAETAEKRAKRILSRVETAATLCALAAGVLGLLVFLRLVDFGGYYYLRRSLGGTAGVVWLAGFLLFAAQCHGLSGWVKALAIYHLFGAPAMAANFTIVCLGCFASAWFAGDVTNMGIPAFLLGIGTTIAFIAYVNPMRLLRRHGTAALKPLVEQLLRHESEPPEQ